MEVNAWVIADPDIDRHPVNMADAPEDDRDEYDPAFDYVHAGAMDAGAPLAPAGAPGVPVPGALANLPSRARLRSYENHNVQRNGSETVSLARSSADR